MEKEIIELNKIVGDFVGHGNRYYLRYDKWWDHTMNAFFKFRDLEFESYDLELFHDDYVDAILYCIKEWKGDTTPLSALKELAKGICWVNEIKK